jgi:Protein of unknown function (DUF4058)
MPSPFPGMDPYIEGPGIWQDFHSDFAAEIRTALNRTIRPRYIAALTAYATYDVVEIARPRAFSPDVAISQPQPPRGEAPTAVATLTRAPAINRVPLELPIRLHRVEVRTTRDETLVTAIEILSPVNKRPGHEAYDEYQRKRRRILADSVHLIEIDLLRGGIRPRLADPVAVAPYYVVLSRVEHRPWVEVWPIPLQEALPAIPVPLWEPDPDAALDLGAVVASVYERGGYEDRIDYREPPPAPPLSQEESAWVDLLLRKHRRPDAGPNGVQ